MGAFAVRYPMFQPAMRLITAISNSDTATVTTSFDHDYLPQLVVRLYVPAGWGMVQANQLVGVILEVPTPTTFVISINTLAFDVFDYLDPVPYFISSYPIVVPVGELNSTLLQSTRNIL